MKIAVSYINSKYDLEKTVSLIDDSIADFIHVDLMDGIYVETKNFNIDEILKLLNNRKKKLNVHLMTIEPEQYIESFASLNLDCIIFHPASTQNPFDLVAKIKSLGCRCGIAINPNEMVEDFSEYYGLVDEILVMSVIPGRGGQEFMLEVLPKLEQLIKLKDNYGFTVAVDGGINADTINYLYNVDLVISGSFICNSDDFDKSINKLKK